MISSFRNFAKTKFAGLLVFIMIIPFVFWGMGSMFSSGNTNNLAKINNKNISTQDLINYINRSGIPQQSIRDNLENNIIEELLSNLISTTLLDLEVKDFHIIISENTLLKKIKENKNFQNENGVFERVKYEKFLIENNLSAPIFELRLKNRETQKNLFDYIGAGTVSPKFLVKKFIEEENKKLEIEFLDLNKFYKKKENISDNDIKKFIDENEDQLKIEYLDFSYIEINPLNLIGINEFNQTFFDKIDQIEIDISNGESYETIVENLNIKSTEVSNFRFSNEKSEIEKKIFELRENKFDIIENKENFVLYNIRNLSQRNPDLKDKSTKKEIIELISQKNKFEYNRNLLDTIRKKEFGDDKFRKMGGNEINLITLNSTRDNKKFNINSVQLLYSLPEKSFTLINDDKKNVYLAKVKKYKNIAISDDNDLYKSYINKENSKNKKNILKSYDLFLNDKYDVVLNQKTIDRVRNFFQ